MEDQDFARYLDEYLDAPFDPNPGMAGVNIVWERENPNYGSRHIWEGHGITEYEVEEVIFKVPPFLEAKRHPDHPNRTLFWGATQNDRWIFVVCEDWTETDTRYLLPITAFEPEEGQEYWEGYK